jgi:hypothetical protein
MEYPEFLKNENLEPGYSSVGQKINGKFNLNDLLTGQYCIYQKHWEKRAYKTMLEDYITKLEPYY